MTTHPDEINQTSSRFVRGEQVGTAAEAAAPLVAEPIPVG